MKLLTEITINNIKRPLTDDIIKMVMDFVAQECCKIYSLDMKIEIKEIIER
jgi:hypothetical protein